MSTSRTGRIALVALAIAAAAAQLGAGGAGTYPYPTVQSISPAFLDGYAAGQLGVVRPSFARRYLAQAYRVFSGRTPLSSLVMPGTPQAGDGILPVRAWIEARNRALGLKPGTPETLWMPTYRRLDGTYQQFINCLDDGVMQAVRTLGARTQRYGAGSAAVRDWLRAQDAVFGNCNGTELRLPDPAPSSADALTRADRTYQRAAAYFYATRYDDAARAFSTIADDRTSPWQPYGRYLAARALLRQGLVPDIGAEERARRLTQAETALRAVLEDPSAATLHGSTRGLLDLVASRLRPIEQVHALSTLLARAPTATNQQVTDFSRLLDAFIGDTVEYTYSDVRERQALIADDEMVDWILAVQGEGDAALARALERWRSTRAPTWLVAVLWKITPRDNAAPAVLEAAAAVDRQSPAFPTVAFLRVRLLTEAGRLDDARALLTSLPDQAAPGFDLEAVNLYRAQRLRLARTLDEFLVAAPRTFVSTWLQQVQRPDGRVEYVPRPANLRPVLDDDAALAMTTRLPLSQLASAATSPSLPARLRARVAMAAFTRAVRLRRDDVARAVAPVLRDLAPPLRADLDRYLSAPTAAARHVAAVKLLLWTPGGASHVSGLDDSETVDMAEPARSIQSRRQQWWCAPYVPPPGDRSPTYEFIHRGVELPYPQFVSVAGQRQAEEELLALSPTADASTYLLAETLAWVKASPRHPDAAEALARAIRGVRYGCSNGDTPKLAREAFGLLHSRYASTTWARQTKYWYADR